MSDNYEPSYYEIALTGRQVLGGFVILLVCLVAAFFSGVWVGRGGGDEDGERPEEVAAEADPGAEGEEARLEELSFFGEEPMKRPRALGEVAREPSAETTLREDVLGAGVDEAPGASDAPAEPPAAEAPPPATAPELGADPRPPRERDARGGRDANPSGSLAGGDVVIQVFSTSEEATAREVLGRLERNGFRAFLSPATDGGRTLYRVRVGPFEHRSEAEEVAERLRRSLNLETWITQ